MDVSLKETLSAFSMIWNHKLFTIAGVKLGLGNLLVALVMLMLAKRLSRLMVKVINSRLIVPFVDDKASQSTYQTFAFYASLILCVTLSMTVAGIPLTIFTVLGGALAIGVGFGSQNVVNNFISGIILLVERPVKVGDIVEVDGVTGVVSSIGTRSTKIRNADNKVFIVPNSFFLEKGVQNWTHETQVLRTSVDFGVAYGSDVRLVENICMDILLNTENIEQTPMPVVLFTDFSESNLNFQLIFHCDLTKIATLAHVRSAVRFKIDDKFRELGIQMAFPQRDMHLRIDRPLNIKMLS